MIDLDKVNLEYRDLIKDLMEIYKENSGAITRILRKKFPDKSLKEIYNLIYNLKEEPICLNCGKPVEFLNFSQGYRKFCCLKYSNSNPKKIKLSNAWYRDSDKLQRALFKRRSTISEKFGCECYTQTKEFKDKSKESTLKHFGCYNGAQKNIKNFNDLNKDFILEHFIINSKLDFKSMCQYFNFGRDGGLAWIDRLNIKIPFLSLNSNTSIGEKEWLDAIGIPNDPMHRQVRIGRYIVDGKEENFVYEYLGDYWHGNLNNYPANSINEKNKQTFQFLYDKTLAKFKNLTEMGYTVLYTWDSTYSKSKTQVFATCFNDTLNEGILPEKETKKRLLSKCSFINENGSYAIYQLL